MAPKRKRLSEKKMGDFKSAVVHAEAQKASKILLLRASELLKQQSPEQLRAVIAFMTESASAACSDSFPRAVAILGGPGGSKSVPLYAVRGCLSMALGLTETQVTAIAQDSEVLRQLFVYSIFAEENSPVPERSMEVEKFQAWFMGQYAKHSVLSDVDFGRCSITEAFETGYIGHYRMVSMEGEGHDYDSIQQLATQRTIKLPKSVGCISHSSLGKEFAFKNNWSMREGVLVRLEEDDTWKLAQRFVKEGVAGQPTSIATSKGATSIASSKGPVQGSEAVGTPAPPEEEEEEEEAPPPPPPSEAARA